MADNTVLQPGSGGDNIATDDLGTVKVQRVKIMLGADGANDGDVNAALPMPARAMLGTGTIWNGTTSLTPKFAAINAAASGDNTVVALVAAKKLRVLSYLLVAAGAVTATWKSSVAGAISGAMSLAANGGAGASFSPVGHFETVAGEALVLNLGGAVQVSGHVCYVEV